MALLQTGAVGCTATAHTAATPPHSENKNKNKKKILQSARAAAYTTAVASNGTNSAVAAPAPTAAEAVALQRHYEQEMLELCARGLPGPNSKTLVPFSMKVTATVSERICRPRLRHRHCLSALLPRACPLTFPVLPHFFVALLFLIICQYFILFKSNIRLLTFDL